MGLTLTASLAGCLWITLWAFGVSGFDGAMVTLVIVLIGATVKSALLLLPGVERPERPETTTGGW